MRSTWKWLVVLCVLGMNLLDYHGPTFSYALTLQEAKSQGLLGERPDGYLGLVLSSAPPEVKTLMTTVNKKRKQKYQEIAVKNGTQLQAVEVLAGKTTIQKTKPGHYVIISGQWVKK